MPKHPIRDTLLAAVQKFIEEHHLLPQSGTVVVGVSGGPDSVCLLHALKTLCAPEGPFPLVMLHVAHLNHLLRGEESQADAAFVADLAAQWSLPCTIEQVDVAAQAKTARQSIEEAARAARYAFLRQVAAEIGAERIAVAHHADDQAETLVMHWLRGSGMAGLAGMHPLEKEVIRPLLAVRRDEILAYCARHHLAFREDSSNQDPRFLRNRIRHVLLPTLEQYNPNLRETLLRQAEIFAEEERYLQVQVAAAWPQVIIAQEKAGPGVARVEGDVAAYRRLPLAIRRRLLRDLGLMVSGGEVSLELRHITAIDALLHRGVAGGWLLHLPRGMQVLRIQQRFKFGRLLAQIPAVQMMESVVLPVPGEACLPGTRWLVRAQILDGASTPSPGYEHTDAESRWGYMDLEAVQNYLPLALRTRRAGDRFRPLGMTQEKKLQDVLVDAKIPRTERGMLPLVCGADGTLLWVPGYLVSDLVKLTPTTRRVLVLEMRPVRG
ncbi:MAG TPA: tRNA lysidine(34) synthetase TilS [Ktedonobacterales bacterium]|jgi:tRNA(Ile)-lysidine synthase